MFNTGIYDVCHDKVKLLNYFSTNIIHGRSAAADDKVCRPLAN